MIHILRSRTHDSSYALYHIGQQATPGVKQFAETGKSDVLDSVVGEQQQQTNAPKTTTKYDKRKFIWQLCANSNSMRNGIGGGLERSVFDEFNIPAVLVGDGRQEAKFFVDSNHSLVSLMTRIVPSPDWFIGVDSFQLCVGGSWIDTVTVEMDPLDAGTDNGFTFTAPNGQHRRKVSSIASLHATQHIRRAVSSIRRANDYRR
ncbi:unnamed protein product [Ceratitis capitata]|uniref:(Mediterranean fruit fly) hypothetical protein n=1 Tax=Ceratitis capitata TaxID=7213 RepID=A0A811UBE1_CERCA|nr:unnamed protein product [Ceratitis capitata]